MKEKKSVFYSPFVRLFYLILLHLIILSCTKVIEPRVESLYLADFKLNSDTDVEALLIIKVNNPNKFDIDVTIKNFRHYRNGELLGTLLAEQRVVLKQQATTAFNIKVVFKKSVFIDSLFTLLMNKDIELNIQGELIVHHWSGDYPIQVNKILPINIKKLLGI